MQILNETGRFMVVAAKEKGKMVYSLQVKVIFDAWMTLKKDSEVEKIYMALHALTE